GIDLSAKVKRALAVAPAHEKLIEAAQCAEALRTISHPLIQLDGSGKNRCNLFRLKFPENRSQATQDRPADAARSRRAPWRQVPNATIRFLAETGQRLQRWQIVGWLFRLPTCSNAQRQSECLHVQSSRQTASPFRQLARRARRRSFPRFVDTSGGGEPEKSDQQQWYDTGDGQIHMGVDLHVG